jgi:putative hydrolase of HD superfamily
MSKAGSPSLGRIVELQEFITAFRDIERTIHMKAKEGHPNENDVEHSYSLALIGWYLADSYQYLDKDLIIKYALVHDLVEVYAGDTYVFAEPTELNSKSQRESDSLKRISREWSDFPDMLKTINNYESMADKESNFIYALDKIMPIILNVISKGHSFHEANVNLKQLHAIKKDKVTVSNEINKYYLELYELLVQNPDWFPK